MIASPEVHGAQQRREDPVAMLAELHAIETARGRLDRHADDPPEKPDGYTLDSLRSPMLEPTAPKTIWDRSPALRLLRWLMRNVT